MLPRFARFVGLPLVAMSAFSTCWALDALADEAGTDAVAVPERALAILKAAVTLDPSHVQAPEEADRLLAIRLYEKYLEMDPESPVRHFVHSRIAECGDPECMQQVCRTERSDIALRQFCVEQYRKAIESMPDGTVDYWYLRAWLNYARLAAPPDVSPRAQAEAMVRTWQLAHQVLQMSEPDFLAQLPCRPDDSRALLLGPSLQPLLVYAGNMADSAIRTVEFEILDVVGLAPEEERGELLEYVARELDGSSASKRAREQRAEWLSLHGEDAP